MDLIDEATVAAVAGELTPIATGIVYCFTIVAMASISDYRRAGEWTEATRRWCERQSINGFPGHCRVRQAEIMRLRGAFAEAEGEARRAVRELTAFGDLPVSAVGFREIGRSVCVWATSTLRTKRSRWPTSVATMPNRAWRCCSSHAGSSWRRVRRSEERWRNSRWPSQEPGCSGGGRDRSRSHDAAEARSAAEELGTIAQSYDAAGEASAHQAWKRPHVRRRCRRGHQGTPPGHQTVDGGRPAVRDRLGPPMPGERAPAGRR